MLPRSDRNSRPSPRMSLSRRMTGSRPGDGEGGPSRAPAAGRAAVDDEVLLSGRCHGSGGLSRAVSPAGALAASKSSVLVKTRSARSTISVFAAEVERKWLVPLARGRSRPKARHASFEH